MAYDERTDEQVKLLVDCAPEMVRSLAGLVEMMDVAMRVMKKHPAAWEEFHAEVGGKLDEVSHRVLVAFEKLKDVV